MTSFAHACPACGTAGGDEFFALDGVPVLSNVLHPTREAALGAATGPVRLGLCRACGLIRNLAHDPAVVHYTADYENSLHFSGRFQSFADALARRLIDDHDVHGKTVVEIGSGKGDFLSLLCRLGDNSGVGYDPSYAGEADAVGHDRVTFVAEPYPDDPGALTADLVCIRHVLEHLDRPGDLVEALARSLGNRADSVIYAEVPDGEYLLRETAVWDVIYEHPLHFTPHALHRLFASAGLGVRTLDSAFGGQFLWVEASPGAGGPPVGLTAPDALADLAADFGRRARERIAQWAGQLDRYATAGQRVAVWGIGSKGVTFLNVVPGTDAVRVVVDLNPRKHGRHVAGTGHVVLGPDAVPAATVDVVLVMNPVYVDEVAALLSDAGVRADVVPVTDSDRTLQSSR